jgi:hypothetical protein
MNLEAKTIPYTEQRYQTCGDYWDNASGKHFRINDMGNEDYAFLVFVHELIEEHLTRRRGLTEPEILAFDLMWEKELAEGKHDVDDEPGHDSRAPYRTEHVFAENVERLLAGVMGIDWNAYGDAVSKSCEGEHPNDAHL